MKFEACVMLTLMQQQGIANSMAIVKFKCMSEGDHCCSVELEAEYAFHLGSRHSCPTWQIAHPALPV